MTTFDGTKPHGEWLDVISKKRLLKEGTTQKGKCIGVKNKKGNNIF
jgi:hypothetical protein